MRCSEQLQGVTACAPLRSGTAAHAALAQSLSLGR